MSTDLGRRDTLATAQVMSEEHYDNVSRMAKALAASGQFKDITQWEQAFGRILLGADMGLTPTQALMSIDVVRGNVQIRGKRLLAWIKQSPIYDYDIVTRSPEKGAIQFWEKSKRTGEWVKVGPRPDGDPDGEAQPITFTYAEAQKVGLTKPTKNGEPSMWVKWPANMCLWRCASIGFNLVCPELSGGITVYTEADSFVDSVAVELGEGDGDGSEPGWHGLSDDLVADVEALLSLCETLGHPLDRAMVQMRLNSQPEDVVRAYIKDTTDMLGQGEKAAE